MIVAFSTRRTKTLIGLVFMLAGMAVPPPPGVDPAAALGASMAVALITTLYGALFANFFFHFPPPSLQTLIGSAVIVVAGLYVLYREGKQSVLTKRT